MADDRTWEDTRRDLVQAIKRVVLVDDALIAMLLEEAYLHGRRSMVGRK